MIFQTEVQDAEKDGREVGNVRLNEIAQLLENGFESESKTLK